MQGKNLQNADLHNANLQNADLQGANLQGANLTGANLRGANLLGAHLGSAKLTGAILQNTNLQHADSEGANYQNANLQQANLQGADLQNAVLTGADLYGANLTRANLFGANLQNANLQTANLHGANLHNASMRGANLQRADLQNTSLIGTNMTGAQLQGANLHGAKRSAPSAIAAATPPAAAAPLPGPPATPPSIYSTGPRPYSAPPRTYSAPPPGPVATQPSFGNAPFGQVPILFNDHLVHTNDVLSRDRVLAALVRGSAILVPLRAMLAQMGGAQVAYDATSRTIAITKAGARVVLTLGVPRVIVNDRVHPLDVAPMLYEGEILVPIRVISEGLGGYVQWVADQHVVVVRYAELAAMLPPTPPPPTPVPATAPPAVPSTPTPSAARTPGPQAAPPPAPTPTPSPPAIAAKKQARLLASIDYMNAPKVSDELAPDHTIANQSFGIQGAYEFGPSNMFLIQFDLKRYQFPHDAFQDSVPCDPAPTGCTTVNSRGQYQTGNCPAHDPGCVTAVAPNIVGAQIGRVQEYVSAFTARDTDVDLRAALKILPRVYVGTGLYYKHYNYLGYPNITGIGAGVSIMPNLDKRLSLFASAWYYPSVTGRYTYPVSPFLGGLSGQTVPFGYSVIKYRAGGIFWLNATNLFLEAGFAGEFFKARLNTPIDAWTKGSFFGIGTRFP